MKKLLLLALPLCLLCSFVTHADDAVQAATESETTKAPEVIDPDLAEFQKILGGVFETCTSEFQSIHDKVNKAYAEYADLIIKIAEKYPQAVVEQNVGTAESPVTVKVIAINLGAVGLELSKLPIPEQPVVAEQPVAPDQSAAPAAPESAQAAAASEAPKAPEAVDPDLAEFQKILGGAFEASTSEFQSIREKVNRAYDEHADLLQTIVEKYPQAVVTQNVAAEDGKLTIVRAIAIGLGAVGIELPKPTTPDQPAAPAA